MAYSASRYSLSARARAAGKVSPLASARARKSRHACGAWLTASMKSLSQADRFMMPTAAPKSFQVSPSTRTFLCGGESSATEGDCIGREGRAARGAMHTSLPHGPDFVVTNLGSGGTVVLSSSNTNPRLILADATGIGDNRVLGVTAVTHTLSPLATDRAGDVTYSVSCGQCPEANGEPRTATHVIGYDSTDLDGEPIGERLFTCVPCFGETYVWAETQNRSFVPPTIDRIPTEAPAPVSASVPRCAFCGAAFYECVTDFRGLCVAQEVSA